MRLSLLTGEPTRSLRESEEAIRHEIRSSPSSESWDAETCANSRFGESTADFEILDADGWVVRIRQGTSRRQHLVVCDGSSWPNRCVRGCAVGEDAPRRAQARARQQRPHGHGGLRQRCRVIGY